MGFSKVVKFLTYFNFRGRKFIAFAERGRVLNSPKKFLNRKERRWLASDFRQSAEVGGQLRSWRKSAEFNDEVGLPSAELGEGIWVRFFRERERDLGLRSVEFVFGRRSWSTSRFSSTDLGLDFGILLRERAEEEERKAGFGNRFWDFPKGERDSK
ncbi:uncharacterized protein A4U43_C05F7440 [Asparagus officinalis]|uniref:Uncharacterized protein n=1 Tax=Asparagus officinalis TaxID=4686 RepID=A0A5P1ETP7_ASPOF|nr:uncharacterized protein A4U43_C05F7440 [Asparagus officinalis]